MAAVRVELHYLGTALLLGTFALNVASAFREFIDKLLWTFLPMSDRTLRTPLQSTIFAGLMAVFYIALFFVLALLI